MGAGVGERPSNQPSFLQMCLGRQLLTVQVLGRRWSSGSWLQMNRILAAAAVWGRGQDTGGSLLLCLSFK